MGYFLNIAVLGPSEYRFREDHVYFSPRYKKTITAEEGDVSDGATYATDIVSMAWGIHDKICKRGTWDDGTPITNWQASRVLSDILKAEKRPFRARYWLISTFLLGGGKARENGMLRAGGEGGN